MHIRSLIPVLMATTAAAVTITDVLSANSNQLSTLTSLLATVPQLQTALTTATNITLIAPSNGALQAAMAAMPNLATQIQNTTFLTNLLEYHVVEGVVSSAMFTTTPMFASTALQVASTTPGTTKGQMVELLKSNADTLVLSGYKQASRVSTADLFFSGGVVHIVDSVLSEPDTTSATALDTGLTSLAGGLLKSGMLAGVDGLSGATVFAPSNAAFASVGNVLEAADGELLSDVLEYHIVVPATTGATTSGALHSTELLAMARAAGGTTTLKSLNGPSLTIRDVNGALYVNNAEITLSDILTSNGVVHVINNVLNPLSTAPSPNTKQGASQVADFAGASAIALPPFASSVTPTATIIPVTVAQVAGGSAKAVPTAALVGAAAAAAAAMFAGI